MAKRIGKGADALTLTRRGLIGGSIAGAVLTPQIAWAAQQFTATMHGLDLAAIDEAVRPGDDFYRYANGKWLDRTDIPADRPNVSELSRMSDVTSERVHAILDTAARMPTSNEERKLGDFYASLMDEAAVKRLGVSPVAADLARIKAVRTPADLARALAVLVRSCPRDNWEIAAPYGLAPASPLIYLDTKDPSRYLPTLIQGGLGLPDRDYYLLDRPNFVAARTAYASYLTALFTLAGFDRPAERAANAARLEAGFASAQRPRAELSNFVKRDNRWTRAQLEHAAPGFDWNTTSTPRYRTVVSILVCPSRICTARRLPVRL